MKMAVGRFLCNQFDLSYAIYYTRKQHPALSTWFGLTPSFESPSENPVFIQTSPTY
jgi:hypothetical protein